MSQPPLWSAEDVARATKGNLIGPDGWAANGVSIDSRSLEAGDLFVAIVGPNSDGHDYVMQAFENGAAAAIVSQDLQATGDVPLIQVSDTLKALNALGFFARDRCAAKRIAITGSVGKTGTKEMMRTVLSQQEPTHASFASYNNLWGVPLTLARMPVETRYGIFEIGMNHAGEITPLTKLVRPDVAIVTTVAPVHLEFFDGIDDIARAKAEIFNGLKAGGTAVINRDIDQFDILQDAATLVPHATLVTFGEHDAADYRLLAVEDRPFGISVSADLAGTELSYDMPLPGRHVALNSLSVLAAVSAVGADIREAAAAMSDLQAVRGRGTRHQITMSRGNIVVIDESYNANPASMAAAIDTLGAQTAGPSGRRIAVLGDMLELGPSADQLHAQLASNLADADIDLVFLAGPHMKALWQALPQDQKGGYADTSADLHEMLLNAITDGDVITVKGSLGSRMGPVVDLLLNLSTDDAALRA